MLIWIAVNKIIKKFSYIYSTVGLTLNMRCFLNAETSVWEVPEIKIFSAVQPWSVVIFKKFCNTKMPRQFPDLGGPVFILY